MNIQDPKIKLAIHLIIQILSQSAVLILVPQQFVPFITAIVAVLGVIAGFSDQTLANAGGWENPRQAGIKKIK